MARKGDPNAVTSMPPKLSPKSKRRAAVGAGVVLAHAAFFTVVALTHPVVPPLAEGPVINVELFQPVIPPPPPPPPPPLPAPPKPVSGGGAPAAPSVIHTPPRPRPVEREVPAPPVKAPAPALVVGVAPVATPTPGLGQGGQGTGTGTGVGDGDGPGSGCGWPPLLERASGVDIVRAAPREAIRRRIDGSADLNCDLRSDTRLENCRVIRETPNGQGFGAAAVRVAVQHFRFASPASRCVIRLGIQFNLSGRRPQTGPLEG